MLTKAHQDTLLKALSVLSVPKQAREKVMTLLSPVLTSVFSLGKQISLVNKSKRKLTRVANLKVS